MYKSVCRTDLCFCNKMDLFPAEFIIESVVRRFLVIAYITSFHVITLNKETTRIAGNDLVRSKTMFAILFDNTYYLILM